MKRSVVIIVLLLAGLATERYSVRSFFPKAGGQEDIDKILLGSCLVGRFDPKELIEALSLPENLVPVQYL